MSRAFLHAVEGGRLTQAKLLHKQGVDINCRNSLGHPALFIAFRIPDARQRMHMLSWLIHAGADTSYVHPPSGRNFLMIATYLDLTPDVKYLLRHGGLDVLAKAKSGMTALHYAVLHNNSVTMHAFVNYTHKYRIPVDVADDSGWTPFAMASVLGLNQIKTILVEVGGAMESQFIFPALDKTRLFHLHANFQHIGRDSAQRGTSRHIRSNSAVSVTSTQSKFSSKSDSQICLKLHPHRPSSAPAVRTMPNLETTKQSTSSDLPLTKSSGLSLKHSATAKVPSKHSANSDKRFKRSLTSNTNFKQSWSSDINLHYSSDSTATQNHSVNTDVPIIQVSEDSSKHSANSDELAEHSVISNVPTKLFVNSDVPATYPENSDDVAKHSSSSNPPTERSTTSARTFTPTPRKPNATTENATSTAINNTPTAAKNSTPTTTAISNTAAENSTPAVMKSKSKTSSAYVSHFLSLRLQQDLLGYRPEALTPAGYVDNYENVQLQLQQALSPSPQPNGTMTFGMVAQIKHLAWRKKKGRGGRLSALRESRSVSRAESAKTK